MMEADASRHIIDLPLFLAAFAGDIESDLALVHCMWPSLQKHRNSLPSAHRYFECRSAFLAPAVEAPTQVRT